MKDTTFFLWDVYLESEKIYKKMKIKPKREEKRFLSYYFLIFFLSYRFKTQFFFLFIPPRS